MALREVSPCRDDRLATLRSDCEGYKNMNDSRVRLMHHDARWRQEFEQTRSNILHSCAGWVIAVEHIGSTAISGLIARPTIDVLAVVKEPAGIAPAASLIEGLNYGRADSPRWAAPATMLLKPRHAVDGQLEPTHCVLLVVVGSPVRDRLIRMRDWLRADTERAIDFEEAKVACWRRSEGDLETYQAEKARCFCELETRMDESEGMG